MTGRRARPWSRSWILLSLWTALLTVVVAQKTPSHKVSDFSNLPARLFFFDDTLSAVYHDAIQGNLYVSQDEGKSWSQAEGIPDGKVATVIEHPFDTRYAFALTDGTTHYRTEDRGRTWRPFQVPLPPARVARPLSFHSDPKKYGSILFQATKCDGPWSCKDVTYYTKAAFGDDVKELLSDTSRCQFAHSSKDFRHDAHQDLVYCVGHESGGMTLESSRLFSSTDFFDKEKKVEDLGIGSKDARGVVAFALVSKFAVVALKDVSQRNGEMHLYVSLDTKTWAKAHFPHASSAQLRENAYTIVESTTHSLGVDVVLKDRMTIGTLFVSNSNGTFFVESLKDTNRNEMGFVDYERVYGVEGVGLANVVANAFDVEARRAPKQLKSLVTFDDGRVWFPLRAPARDVDGHKMPCEVSDLENCSLHLHSVTNPHNFGRVFSSPAPGFVMGVGSIGKSLGSYEQGDTFLSTDGGLSWQMVAEGAHKYEFGDQGSILVIVDDEQLTKVVKYSLNLGKTWEEYDFGIQIRARALLTLPDSTSQKFLLLGQVPRDPKSHEGSKVVIVYLDFAPTRSRKCGDSDFEKWYARPPGKRSCLMGHKQWYRRRKENADCYVGDKFQDPVGQEENCACETEDYECDYNFVQNGDKCEPVGPEPIPAGVCTGDPKQKYKGSSGFRKIPGNTCEGGKKLDEKIDKPCSKAQPKEGSVSHQTFSFKAPIQQYAYFKDSTTILVRLLDYSIWQSSSEGYTWTQLFPGKRFLAFYHHKYSNERAYLITDSKQVYITTDTGRTWNHFDAPSLPNTFGAQVLRFNPKDTEQFIWVGNHGCNGSGEFCHAEAHLTRNNGRNWVLLEKYVRNCAFARDKELDTDPTEIICESYRDKKGNQHHFKGGANPLELVVGSNYYQQGKKKLFDHVVGFAKFSEFLVVAEMVPEKRALELQVSLDGKHFASGQFPPSMHPETHAYTVLESSTKSLFLHMTMSEPPAPYWGNLLKSNSNGTYFGVSIENVNRDDRGFVDFEKVIGLDGIALINVVSNPDEAAVSGKKKLVSRITHNDGSTWKPLTPPALDAAGNKYKCEGTKCALHIHGYTERRDPRATFSSPSVVGLMMGVGNVGESILPYAECDTFLSRDAGFTWEEVSKDAHMFEFGDSGSVLIIVNDEEPTDVLRFTTDEGKTWREYKFSEQRLRVMSVMNVPSDTSRRFLLLGQSPTKSSHSVAIHVDFSALVTRQCSLDLQNPTTDDFELWSPSEDRVEQCLFGRQTVYHRRIREAQCYIGNMAKAESKTQKNCPCAQVDFECEFNHVKNEKDECVLVPGTKPLPDDDSCKDGEEFWYERTPYRIIPYSSCEGGKRPDRGAAHRCPGFKSKSAWFWMFMLLIPFAFTSLVGYYYYRRSGLARGTIRLPGADAGRSSLRGTGESGFLDTIASIPWFIVGVAGIAVEWVSSRLDSASWRASRGYRNVPIDEDAQVLRFEDEE